MLAPVGSGFMVWIMCKFWYRNANNMRVKIWILQLLWDENCYMIIDIAKSITKWFYLFIDSCTCVRDKHATLDCWACLSPLLIRSDSFSVQFKFLQSYELWDIFAGNGFPFFHVNFTYYTIPTSENSILISFQTSERS